MNIKHIIAFALTAMSLNTYAKITVTEPWVRATVTGQTMGGAFMTLHNDSAQEARVIAVSTNAAQEAQLHTMIEKNGMMQMSATTAVTIPAAGSFTFKPGSTHIMLMGLQHSLQAGDRIPLVLTVVQHGHTKKIQVTAEVRPLGQ
ncbi:hypothetical protein DTO96_100571 [Ephemeroptericola cinctiostellae]|uniref:Copper chaperone PCu(A)C n=1 Tax=Ephemeroptericola cinctiostellae TaxID=2268024 RepID=A0A345D922_9BURK|nr:copper chaperone PCu(A)C [Ephemeroptericola cinctiostellae]AXF84860.1 hypothetical protein DTO96_100571 [Ephemeroptericola cinctiostellae]